MSGDLIRLWCCVMSPPADMALLSKASAPRSFLTLIMSLIPQSSIKAIRRVKAPKPSKIHLLATCLEISNSTVVPKMADAAETIFC